MKEQELVNLITKGAIADLPQDEQKKVQDAYNEIKTVLLKHGFHSLLAFALLGSEIQDDNFFKEVG